MVTEASSTSSDFDPVQFVVDTIPMDQWQFPIDGLALGIVGVADWLREDQMFFTPPIEPVLVHPIAPMNAPFPDFFPDPLYPYSPNSHESNEEKIFSLKENNYQALEPKPLLQPRNNPPTNCLEALSSRENITNYPEIFHCLDKQNTSLQTKMEIRENFVFPEPNKWHSPPQVTSPLHLQWPFVSSPHVETPPCTPIDYNNLHILPSTPRKRPGKPKEVRPKIEEVCSNCNTKVSPMWRWNTRGDRECNACNLYEVHRGHKRPPELWKAKPITRRKRNPNRVSPYEAKEGCKSQKS